MDKNINEIYISAEYELLKEGNQFNDMVYDINLLFEERGMMTMFSPAIDNIVDLIIKHYNDDFIYNNMNIFPTIYSFLHIYKNHKKYIKIYDEDKKELIFDFSSNHKLFLDDDFRLNNERKENWHRIYIIITDNKLLKEKAACQRNNETSDNSVPVYIFINKDKIKNERNELKQTIIHELTHVIPMFKNSKNYISGNLGTISNDFNEIPEQITDTGFDNYIKRFCYLISEEEHNAFISETSEAIMELSDYEIEKLYKIEKDKSQTDLINYITAETFIQNRYDQMKYFMDEIYKISYGIPSFYNYLLPVYLYYFKKTKSYKVNTKSIIIDKNFIIKYLNREISISKIQFDEIYETVKYRITYIFNKYALRLRKIIYESYIKRRRSYQYT